MKEQAFKYFKSHPWYSLNIQPSVRQKILNLWIQGYELPYIAREMLTSNLGIQSIISFKKYLVNTAMGNVDPDSEAITKEILGGFIDFVSEIYGLYEQQTDRTTEEILTRIHKTASKL